MNKIKNLKKIITVGAGFIGVEISDELKNLYGFDKIIEAENSYYKLIGLPFFNEKNNSDFVNNYNKLLKGE